MPPAALFQGWLRQPGLIDAAPTHSLGCAVIGPENSGRKPCIGQPFGDGVAVIAVSHLDHHLDLSQADGNIPVPPLMLNLDNIASEFGDQRGHGGEAAGQVADLYAEPNQPSGPPASIPTPTVAYRYSHPI